MIIFSGRLHVYFCLIIWIFFAVGGTFLHPIMFLGTLFPDSDIRKSMIGKFIPLWLVFRHRGPTHTLWFMAVTGVILWWTFGWWVAISWTIGYFLHLMMDSATPSGIKWF